MLTLFHQYFFANTTITSATVSLAIDESYLYIVGATNPSNLYVCNITNPTGPVVLSTTSFGTTSTVRYPIVNNKSLYAIDTVSASLYVMNISNPLVPVLSAKITLPAVPLYHVFSGQYDYDYGQEDC